MPGPWDEFLVGIKFLLPLSGLAFRRRLTGLHFLVIVSSANINISIEVYSHRVSVARTHGLALEVIAGCTSGLGSIVGRLGIFKCRRGILFVGRAFGWCAM